MGSALSWLRGGASKEDTEKVLKELDEKIIVEKEALAGYIASHRGARGWLLKLFVPVQVALVAWFYLRTRPESIVEQLRDASVVLVWPVLCFGLKMAVDTYYRARVRRGEAKLRDLFDLQVKELRAIEDDPAFKRQMELLQKYGRNVPAYAVQQSPQSHVRQRPVATAATGSKTATRPAAEDPSATPMRPNPTATADAPPAHAEAGAAPAADAAGAAVPAPALSSPHTPKVYTQPVDRKVRAAPQPPVLTPLRGGGGSFLQSLIDAVVGDGPALGEILACAKCNANNGVVPKNSVPDVWACKVCGAENKKQPKTE